jgi:hypothetical protein
MHRPRPQFYLGSALADFRLSVHAPSDSFSLRAWHHHARDFQLLVSFTHSYSLFLSLGSLLLLRFFARLIPSLVLLSPVLGSAPDQNSRVACALCHQELHAQVTPKCRWACVHSLVSRLLIWSWIFISWSCSLFLSGFPHSVVRTDFLLVLSDSEASVSFSSSWIELVSLLCSSIGCHSSILLFWWCDDSCRWKPLLSWVTGSKDSRLSSLNRSSTVISRTRPPGVRWNDYKDINCSLIWFLLSISHVFLLASFCVSTAIPNPVSRANRFSIAIRSWPS